MLYVTWSSALAEDAAAHFESFAAPNVKTTCVDYTTLLGEITSKRVRRISLRQSTKRFARVLTQMDQSQAKGWGREPQALHAELRGVLLGSATGIGSDAIVQDKCLRLTPEGYRRPRARLGRIDERSMRSLVRTAAENLRRQVLTPAEAKGLEYQTVCIVNLGVGCAVAAGETSANRDEQLSQEIRRNAIDQVRVAISRSTNMLAIIEHGSEGGWANAIDNTIEFSPEDLVVRHVTIFGRGHGLQRAIIDESQHRTPERLIMAQH